ncbi:hypothetical protein QG060_10255, partial [Kingella kingae]|nr:hypothetical protein [Kingella kingae]
NIKKNGYSGNRKQKYFCKDCCRNFIGDHNLTYKGCHSKADEQVWRMTVRGCGIRDIAAITGFGIEGNNCRLRHKVRRAFRKTCCFSNSMFYHKKVFDLAF